MFKGCQKKIIVIQGGERSPFETAFFLLRREIGGGSSDDIIREADRIISEGLPAIELRRRRKERFFKLFFPSLAFLVGVLFGTGICALFILILL